MKSGHTSEKVAKAIVSSNEVLGSESITDLKMLSKLNELLRVVTRVRKFGNNLND